MKKWMMATLVAIICIVTVSCADKTDTHTHNYAEKTYEATCTEWGYTEKICTVCAESERYDFIACKGHDYTKNTVAPTCTVQGYDLYTCKVCESTKKDNFKDATGHNYQSKTVAPTCEEQGYTLHACTKCADTYKDDFVLRLDHVPGDWITIKAPTCLEAGKRIQSCEMCGKELKSEQSGVTEHSYAVYSTVAPSDGEEGYIIYKCKICGSSYRGEYVNSGTENSAVDVYNLIKDATVSITAYNKQGKAYSKGSGFFISSDGEIITNYHVIKSAYSLKVTLLSGNTYTVSSVISYDSAQDIAMIKINLSDTPFIKISTEDVKTGDTVYALGSSLGLIDSLSSGIVSNPDRLVAGVHYIQMTTPISSGNSGGPLVNSKGELVGINTMSATYGQNLNFAIKAERIGELTSFYNKSVSQLYYDKTDENAFDILKIYIFLNAEKSDGTNYMFSLSQAETETDYGTETYFIYDSENDTITIEHNLISNSEIKFTVYTRFGKVGTTYPVYLYDYSIGQTGIEAVVNGLNADGSYEDCFDDAVTIEAIRYPETSDDANQRTQDRAKHLFYVAYQSMVAQLYNLIVESHTGITLGNFNFTIPTT